jgi:hypothetical protein
VNAEDTGRLIGLLLVPLFFLILVVWLAWRAKTSEPRSRRLAGYGLACGLVVLPALGVLTAAGPVGGRPVFIAVGGAMLLAGAAAIALGVMAVSARKADGGTGGSVGAFIAGGASLFLGLGAAMLPVVNGGSGDDGPPFAHRVEGHGFEITIPGPSWKPFAGPKKIADFATRMPQMVGGVMMVEADATGTKFEAEVARAKQVARGNAATQTVLLDERGTNDHGQPVWVLLLDEHGGDQRIYTGMSVTWLNKAKVVVLFFEGQHRNRSQAGQRVERAAFETAAPRFLRSVR